MNKKVWIVGGILATILLIIGIVIATTVKPSGTQSETNVPASNGKYTAIEACNLLTQQIANDVLGSNAEKSETNNSTSSDDISVSTCTYSAAHDGSIQGAKNAKIATILVRSPLSDAGASSNKQPFEPAKSGTQNVTGYGDMAFWDPEFGQLNVYKNGTWLIASLGIATPSENTLEDAKKLADKIVPAL